MSNISTHSKMTLAAIAEALGLGSVTVSAKRVAAAIKPDEVIIGTWRGPICYVGETGIGRVQKRYPAMTRMVLATYGRATFLDVYAIIAPCDAVPTGLTLH
jgi:hypothetical protein